METTAFSILQIFFRIKRVETKRLPSKTFTVYDVDFLVFSGTPYRPAGLFLLLTQRQTILPFDTNFNCILDTLKFWKLWNITWGIIITRIFPSIRSRGAFRPIACGGIFFYSNNNYSDDCNYNRWFEVEGISL